MGIGFPLLRALFAGRTGDDHGIPVTVQRHVIGNFNRELVGLVKDGRQKLGLGHHASIVVGEHKIAIQHCPHGVRIMGDLHLVPEIFQRNDLRFIALCPGNVLRKGLVRDREQEN